MDTHNLTGPDLDLTILIPTHERKKYLKQSISYFHKIPVPVVYADSSNHKYDGPLAENIRYIHYSHNENLPEKILYSLDTIDTKYVALCADDDFLLYSALSRGSLFLKNNPAYKTVSGRIFLFREEFDGKFYEFYRTSYDRDINQGPDNNAKSFFSDYFQTVWAIHEKTKLRKTITLLVENQWNNAAIFEIIFGAINCFEGGIRVLPEIFGLREMLRDDENLTRSCPLDQDRDELARLKTVIDANTAPGYSDIIINNINCYYFNFLTDAFRGESTPGKRTIRDTVTGMNPWYWKRFYKIRCIINEYRAKRDWVSLKSDEIDRIVRILTKNDPSGQFCYAMSRDE